jgi:type II secretory pathway component PulK
MKTLPACRIEKNRDGSVLICVLVCLGIASIVSLGTLKTSLTHRRELQRHWQMEQTQWMLEAGWRRALKARLADDQYTGEVWELVDVLESDLNATVEIAIKPEVASPGDLELMITVTLQTNERIPITTRRSHSWQLQKTQSDNDSPETEDSR